MQLRRDFLVRAAASTLPLIAAPPPALGQTLLRMNIIAPPQNWLTRELSAWAQDVGRATQGRVAIEAVAAPLGGIPRVIDLVETGVADLSPGQHGPIGGRFVLTQVLDIPFIAPTAEAASVALWRLHKAHLEKADEHRGVTLLSLWASAPTHLMSKTASLTSMDEVRGRKIIAVSPTAARIAQALGAVGVGGAPTEWHEMLTRGIADGALASTTAVEAFRLGGTLRSMLGFETSLFRTSFFLAINRDKWNALLAADRDAVMALAGEALARRMGAAFDAAEAAALQSLRAQGMAIKLADAATLAAVAQRLAFLEADWRVAAQKAGVDPAASLALLRSQAAAARR